MYLTKKRESCAEVFKDTDHIIVVTTGIHPGFVSFFGLVRGVILQIVDHQGHDSPAERRTG